MRLKSKGEVAELFQVSVKTVNEHLINIYGEGELDPEATIRSFRIVQTEGSREVSRAIDQSNLDAILAVGYRVRPARGAAFRLWATSCLSELPPSRIPHLPLRAHGPEGIDEAG